MRRACALAIAMSLVCVGTAAPQDEDIFKNRPAFSFGDQPAQRSATCGEVRAMAAGLPDTDMRMDLSIVGVLALVRTDGALWYFGMCAPPDVRVLCVAYQENGMKVGDKVYMKGGFRRLGPDHIVLDPCLANWPDDAEKQELEGGGNAPPP